MQDHIFQPNVKDCFIHTMTKYAIAHDFFLMESICEKRPLGNGRVEKRIKFESFLYRSAHAATLT